MKSVTNKNFRYHSSGASAITVRGLLIPTTEYLYSDVALLTSADLAANTAVIAESWNGSAWVKDAGTYGTPIDPTGLSGVVGESAVRVNWVDAVNADVASYEVSVSPAVVGTPFTIAQGEQTLLIPGMTDGTPYTITVKTVDVAGNKSTGASVIKTPADSTPPADVTRVNAVKGAAASQTVTVTWVDPTDNVGVNHIEIDVKEHISGTAFTGSPFSVAVATQTKDITGLTTGTMYDFTVKGVDAAGNKSPGITTVATPL